MVGYRLSNRKLTLNPGSDVAVTPLKFEILNSDFSVQTINGQRRLVSKDRPTGVSIRRALRLKVLRRA